MNQGCFAWIQLCATLLLGGKVNTARSEGRYPGESHGGQFRFNKPLNPTRLDGHCDCSVASTTLRASFAFQTKDPLLINNYRLSKTEQLYTTSLPDPTTRQIHDRYERNPASLFKADKLACCWPESYYPIYTFLRFTPNPNKESNNQCFFCDGTRRYGVPVPFSSYEKNNFTLTLRVGVNIIINAE